MQEHRATDWEAWHILLAVVRTGSLQGGAAALGIDATTAGRRLRRLQTERGFALLRREGGRLVPTGACIALIPHLEAADAAMRAVGHQEPVEASAHWRILRLTAVAFLCDHFLAPALPELLDRWRLKIELMAENRNLNLVRCEADLGLRFGAPPDRAAATLLGDVAYAVYSPAIATVDPATLPWAALDTAEAYLPETRWTEREAGAGGIRHRASRFETLHAFVAGGIARCLLPCLMGDRDPHLARQGGACLHRPLWLLWHPDDTDTPHIKAARHWIVDQFSRIKTE